jgi:hypothetical protein
VSHVHGIPIVEGAVHGAGTAIGDGFVVAEGSWLVGPPFPQAQRDGGWRAVLLVTGEIDGVMNDYVRQARALGLQVDAPRCQVHGSGASCKFEGAAGARDSSRLITAALERGPGFTPRSHLFLSYFDLRGPDRGTPDERDARVDNIPNVLLPSDWPVLTAAEGGFFGAAVRLAKGTRLVAPQMDFGPGEIYAVLAVTSDGDDVLERYDRQLLASTAGWKRYRDDVINVRDGQARRVVYGTFDASFELTFAPSQDGNTFLLVEQRS